MSPVKTVEVSPKASPRSENTNATSSGRSDSRRALDQEMYQISQLEQKLKQSGITSRDFSIDNV